MEIIKPIEAILFWLLKIIIQGESFPSFILHEVFAADNFSQVPAMYECVDSFQQDWYL